MTSPKPWWTRMYLQHESGENVSIFLLYEVPEVNVDEECVEPPVDHEKPEGDLIAADQLDEALPLL